MSDSGSFANEALPQPAVILAQQPQQQKSTLHEEAKGAGGGAGQDLSPGKPGQPNDECKPAPSPSSACVGAGTSSKEVMGPPLSQSAPGTVQDANNAPGIAPVPNKEAKCDRREEEAAAGMSHIVAVPDPASVAVPANSASNTSTRLVYMSELARILSGFRMISS